MTKRLPIGLVLIALFCGPSFAQESESREPEARDTASERQRGAKRNRGGQRKLTVEDPAGFKTEGRQLFSGPQPGERLPAFMATSLAGDTQGKELDPIAWTGDGPLILFFQDESGVAIRGLFGVARAIGKIDEQSDQDLNITCVFLSDDAESITSRFAGVFPRLLGLGMNSISLSKDGRDGPGTYGLNRTVAQTIILAKDGKVTHNFVFPQGMLYADPHVLGGIAELIGEDRDTVASWLAESSESDAQMEMRGGGDRQPRPTAALRRKLGEFVKAGKITRKEAGELYRLAFPETDQAKSNGR